MTPLERFIAAADSNTQPDEEALQAARRALRREQPSAQDADGAEQLLTSLGWHLQAPMELARTADYFRLRAPICVLDAEEAARGNLDAALRIVQRIAISLSRPYPMSQSYSTIELSAPDLAWLAGRLNETYQHRAKTVSLVRTGRGRPRLDTTRRLEQLAAALATPGTNNKEAAELTLALKPNIQDPSAPTREPTPLDLNSEQDHKTYSKWHTNYLKPGRKLKKRQADLREHFDKVPRKPG